MKNAGWFALVAAMATVPVLQGCFPMAAMGGVGVGAMVNDRRTSGTQIDDEGIELRGAQQSRIIGHHCGQLFQSDKVDCSWLTHRQKEISV